MKNDPTQHRPYQVDALIDANLSVFSAPQSNLINSKQRLLRINARGIADPEFGLIEHGSIVLEEIEGVVTILASGHEKEIDILNLPASIPQLTLNSSVVMPAMVNAHTHLDLTHIGPQPHDPAEGFVQWVNMIREGRKSDPQEVRDAVALGILKCLKGGCIAIGDIAGAPRGILTDAPLLELADSPLIGVSYLEFFGIGKTAISACQKIESYFSDHYPQTLNAITDRFVRLGLQPHAPNTVDLSVYRWARLKAHSFGLPISTHLAETIEERAFIEQAQGPQRTMLEDFGVWDDSVLDHIGKGNHPAKHLLSDRQIDDMQNQQLPSYLVAHMNDAPDEAIELLKQSNTSVAYCPRASSYFGAHQHFGAHRYIDMLNAGVNVCLGTDSIVNLDTADRISILDEMRFLWNRDKVEPKTLIQMSTTNGAQALGLDPAEFTLQAQTRPWGLIALPIDPECPKLWPELMSSNLSPQWVFLRRK